MLGQNPLKHHVYSLIANLLDCIPTYIYFYLSYQKGDFVLGSSSLVQWRWIIVKLSSFRERMQTYPMNNNHIMGALNINMKINYLQLKKYSRKLITKYFYIGDIILKSHLKMHDSS